MMAPALASLGPGAGQDNVGVVVLLDQSEYPLVALYATGAISLRHFDGVIEDRRAGIQGVVHQSDAVGFGEDIHHAREMIGERVTDHDPVDPRLMERSPSISRRCGESDMSAIVLERSQSTGVIFMTVMPTAYKRQVLRID